MVPAVSSRFGGNLVVQLEFDGLIAVCCNSVSLEVSLLGSRLAVLLSD